MATLHVVATPIGNLSDLSPNMADALKSVGLIAAEDTRVTYKLLSHLGIQTPMISCHRHNEEARAREIVARMLTEDINVALVSDAGTPGLSDPGSALVREAVQAGIRVSPICGPSAVAAALSVSGFGGASFAFHGFLPREEGPRCEALTRIAQESCPVAVLYESPHRVIGLVASIVKVLPQARLCLCCDLSKRYELILHGSPQSVLDALSANPKAEKGEYVLVMELSDCPKAEPAAMPANARTLVLDALLDGASHKDAVAMAVSQGIPRNEAYQASLDIKKLFS